MQYGAGYTRDVDRFDGTVTEISAKAWAASQLGNKVEFRVLCLTSEVYDRTCRLVVKRIGREWLWLENPPSRMLFLVDDERYEVSLDKFDLDSKVERFLDGTYCTETVMAPLDSGLMEAIAQAESVEVKVGPSEVVVDSLGSVMAKFQDGASGS